MTNIEWLDLAIEAIANDRTDKAIKCINEVKERLKTRYEDDK